MKVAKELKALKKSKKSKNEEKDYEFVAKQIHELLIKLKGDEYYEYLALQTLSSVICSYHGISRWEDYTYEQLEKNIGGN